MVNWESQSKTPAPPSPEDGHIYCILLIRIAFYHVSENLPLHCLFHVTINIYFYFYYNIARDVVTARRFCLYLHNIYHFSYTFSHVHTVAHTRKHTCTISTQEEWRQPGTGAWLREAEIRLLLEILHTNKKNVRKKTIFTDLKKRLRAHRASSKATRLFLTK